MNLFLRHARVVTCAGPAHAPSFERLGVIDDGAVLVVNGRVLWVGDDASRPRANTVAAVANMREVDCCGQLMLPGLIDPHTHLVYGGNRADEFARKMAGEDYRQIAASGGGIMSTVRATRAASEERLLELAVLRARAMSRHGVTTVEVKSGYGLTVEDELKILRVARQLDALGFVNVMPTCLGAHTVPAEFKDDRAAYVRLLVDELLPEVASQGLATTVDAYIDDGAFTVDEAREIFMRAQDLELPIRAHVGQFKDVGGAELVAQFDACSVDHLENVSDQAARILAQRDVAGVLLPGAWRTLRQTPPDARKLRSLGLSLAIGTDCNPGTSPCTDLPLCMALAVRDAGLSVEEAILGVTANAARALRIQGIGFIAPGANADIALYAAETPAELCYALGDTFATAVLKDGNVTAGALPD